MTISVVIPTYRRPNDLRRCLEALMVQTSRPDEVIVVIRDSDQDTQAFFQGFDHGYLPMCLVTVTVTGQVAALNAALAYATGDIIAFTDDDAAPHPDWLQRITAHFAADPQVGGVGGRDWQPDERGERAVVGKVQWFGRTIGNHHLGVGEPREVEILKGANMSYRRAAIADNRFNECLHGKGAQVHNDMAFSLAVKQSGWKIIYDPCVAIDHYPAERFDADTNLRGIFNAEGIYYSSYNGTVILLVYLTPFRRVAFLAWSFLVGTVGEPGILQIPRLMARRDRNLWPRLRAACSGRADAVMMVLGRKQRRT